MCLLWRSESCSDQYCESENKEEMLWKHFWENRRLLLDRNIGLPQLDQIFLLSGNPYFHTLPTQPSLISVIFLDYDPMLCFTMLSVRKSELLLRYFLIGGVQEQPRIRLSWVFWYWCEITNWLCDNKILGILKLHVMVDSWKRREAFAGHGIPNCYAG